MNNSAPSLKVLTYNVNFGLARMSRNNTIRSSPASFNVIKVIKESECDIVALQETNAAWEVLMRNEAVYQLYPHQVWFHRGAAGGQALLSKLPIEHSEMCNTRAHLQESWFEQMYCILSRNPQRSLQEDKDHSNVTMHDLTTTSSSLASSSPTRIHLVSVHLRPPKGWMWWTSSYRAQELQYLFDSIVELKNAYRSTSRRSSGETTPRLPLIVCGDFNENDGYSALRWLHQEMGLRDGLHDQVNSIRETMRTTVSFLGFRWEMSFRLDHIFYDPLHFHCSKCEVIDGYETNASDHQPVRIELQLKESNTKT